MRTFIALELPEEFSMQVAELARGLREQGLLQGRFMCRSTYHITLAFIGDVGEAEAQRVIDVLDEVRPKLSAIELRSVGLKKFGRGNTATIALELEPNDALLDAAAFVRSALDARGIAFDDKKFVPHITLARKVQVLTDDLRNCAFPIPAQANEITFYRSYLSSDGATYKPLYSITWE